MTNPVGAPECFGQIWSEKAAECQGGYDPAFTGPDGSKVRPRCYFFDSCKTRSLLKQAQTRPALVPPQSLLRPPYQTAATPYQHHGLVPGRPVQVSPPAGQPAQPQASWYPQMTVRPMEMIPASHHMPSYLSEPEARLEGESYWAPFSREVFRGIGKAIGHSVAHFFDNVPFARREQK